MLHIVYYMSNLYVYMYFHFFLCPSELFRIEQVHIHLIALIVKALR